MSEIRSLREDDLSAAVALFEQVMATGSPLPDIERLFRSTFLDQPFADPELPSLVCEADGKVIGFLGCHARRLRFADRELRAAWAGQLVVAPDARTQAVGPMLIARLFGGPQDVTLTDTASWEARRIWEGLHGQTLLLESLEWTRVLRPAAYWQGRLAASSVHPHVAAAGRRASPMLDAALAKAGFGGATPGRPDGVDDERLTPDAMLEQLDAFVGRGDLRPVYDAGYLAWLLHELGTARAGSALAARLVRRGEVPIGWHVSLVEPHGVAHVLQVVARPRERAAVFEALLDHAYAQGAVAVQGRLEPHLTEAITQQRCVLRRGSYAGIHAREPELVTAALAGRSMLSRLDGEWWIDPRVR